MEDENEPIHMAFYTIRNTSPKKRYQHVVVTQVKKYSFFIRMFSHSRHRSSVNLMSLYHDDQRYTMITETKDKGKEEEEEEEVDQEEENRIEEKV